jgi:hypothetical protein
MRSIGHHFLAAVIVAIALYAVYARPAAAADRLTGLIARVAHGTETFRVASDSPDAVIHIQSNMRCPDVPGGISLSRLRFVPNAPSGEEAACDYVIPGGKLTLSATHLNSTMDTYIASAVQAVRQDFPGANLVDMPTGNGVGDRYWAVFRVDRMRKRALVAVVAMGDWTLSLRATYPEAEREDAENFFNVLFVQARLSMGGAR